MTYCNWRGVRNARESARCVVLGARSMAIVKNCAPA